MLASHWHAQQPVAQSVRLMAATAKSDRGDGASHLPHGATKLSLNDSEQGRTQGDGPFVSAIYQVGSLVGRQKVCPLAHVTLLFVENAKEFQNPVDNHEPRGQVLRLRLSTVSLVSA